MLTRLTTVASIPVGSPGSFLGTKLTSDQQAQIKANIQASQSEGVQALVAGLAPDAPILTLPELFLLPYTGSKGLLVYNSASQAAIGDTGAVELLTDLQTFAKVSASDNGILFDCTTSESLYMPVNICYNPVSRMPRTIEQLFPTLVVELKAQGRPLSMSLAPTIIGEGFAFRANSTYSGSYTTQSSSSSGVNKGLIAVGVIMFVLIAVLVLVALRKWKQKGEASGQNDYEVEL
jgi:hypothetical protein